METGGNAEVIRADNGDGAREGHGPLTLVMRACNIPHPDKLEFGGEDAFVVSNRYQIFGIADGVSRSRVYGFPSKTARVLLGMAHKQTTYGADLDHCITSSFNMLARYNIKGSSTLLFAKLIAGRLHIRSLGDCQLILLRRQADKSFGIFYITNPQYNDRRRRCPFQIGFGLRPRFYNKINDRFADTISVNEGDLIIAGSDGLFNPLGVARIIKVVNDSIERGYENLAERLSHHARKATIGRDGVHLGCDDISTIVALVKRPGNDYIPLDDVNNFDHVMDCIESTYFPISCIF